jgi:hypothetical protein
MNRSLILVAALALCNLAQADDINRCVGSNGEITLTDAPCPDDAPAAVKPAPAARGITVDRMAANGAYTPHDNFVPKQPVSRGLSRDVATLKMARQTMLLLDNAAASMRSQRVASR